MKTRKMAALFAVALLAAVCLGAVVGCGQNSEGLVRTGVAEELDGMKNLDDASLSEFTSGVNPSDAAALSQMGVDMKEFAKTYLNGFDYQIDDVAVDGTKAQVQLELTCKSFKSCEKAITDETQSLTNDPSSARLSQSELMNKLGYAVISAVATVQPTQIDSVMLEYELKDNTWTPTDAGLKSLYGAMMS